MSLNTKAILNAIISHAEASGHFERFAGHDFTSAPGAGVWGSVFLDSIDPSGEVSGLNAASARVVVQVRITQNMLKDPQDDIDPEIAAAVDVLLDAILGDFTLGGLVRNIDVFGETGQGVFVSAGYFEQDHKNYRATDITIPMIINDVWSLTP